MAETLTLTTPVVKAALTTWRVIRLELDLGLFDTSVTVYLRGSDGSQQQYQCTGPQAQTLITALNKANLSVKSLQRRILEQLAQDHPKLTGTVGGTVD